MTNKPLNDTIHKVNERVRASDLDALSRIYEATLQALLTNDEVSV